MAKSKQRERDEARRLKHAIPARQPGNDSEEVYWSIEQANLQYECVECLRFPHAQWCLVQTSPRDAAPAGESPVEGADSNSTS